MFPYHTMVALDLARQRAQEEADAADRRRLAHDAELAASVHMREGRMRAWLARPIRVFSDATYNLSEAACEAATRIEGRTA
jgi:hypothetical protein